MPPTSTPPDLLIDVFELARTGGDVSGALPLSALPRLASSLASAQGEVRFGYRGYRDAQGRPAGTLTFDATVELTCDCCTQPVAVPLRSQARYYFVSTERELGSIPVDEAEEEPLLGSARFALATLIEDDAILALPMSPRHVACDYAPAVRPEAPGEATAAPEQPHPFAALAKLKPRKD